MPVELGALFHLSYRQLPPSGGGPNPASFSSRLWTGRTSSTWSQTRRATVNTHSRCGTASVGAVRPCARSRSRTRLSARMKGGGPVTIWQDVIRTYLVEHRVIETRLQGCKPSVPPTTPMPHGGDSRSRTGLTRVMSPVEILTSHTQWSIRDLNPAPLACHASALPDELMPRVPSNGVPPRATIQRGTVHTS